MRASLEPGIPGADAKPRILLAEDDGVSRLLVRSALAKWGYDVVVARDGEEAWAALQAEDAPRLAIIDWLMPKVDGAELCRRVRARESGPYLYVILLTALGSEADLVRGMEAGADDYVTKPFHAAELRVRLRAGERIVALETRLTELSVHDAMTGLYGRRWLHDHAEKLLAGAARRGRRVGFVMCDLDHFKLVNDAHGHDAGDAVLKQAAQLIRRSVRASDVVVRFGGEEFLVVLVDVAEGVAARVAEKIRARMAAAEITLPGGIVRPTISAGVSEFPRDGGDLWECLKRADVALYQAKALGRNRTVRFGADVSRLDAERSAALA